MMAVASFSIRTQRTRELGALATLHRLGTWGVRIRGVRGREEGVRGRERGLRGRERGVRGREIGVRYMERGVMERERGVRGREGGVEPITPALFFLRLMPTCLIPHAQFYPLLKQIWEWERESHAHSIRTYIHTYMYMYIHAYIHVYSSYK